MSFRLFRPLSVARLKQQPVRTAVSVLCVAIGVALLVSILLVNESITEGVVTTIDDLAGKADLQLSAGATGFEETLVERVRELDGVFKATPRTQQVASLLGESGQRERVLVMGVDLLGSDDAYFRDYASEELPAIKRDQLSFLNSTHNIILAREVAERLGVGLHDKVRMAASGGIEEFEVWGFVEMQGVGSAFGGAIALMYYPAMQVAFGRGRNIDVIDIAVEPGADVDATAARLQEAIGGGFTLERPARRGGRIEKMLLAVRTGLTMASLTALLAGAFIVFNTTAIGVLQRKRELGTLRALGSTRGQLTRLLTLEGALIGAAGAALGVALGVAISGAMMAVASRVISELYVQQGSTDVQVRPELLLLGLVLGIGASALAARVATQRIAGLQPRAALSAARAPLFVPPAAGVSKSEWVGLGLIVLAGALLGLPEMLGLPLGPLAAMVALAIGVQPLVPRLLRGCERFVRPLARGGAGGGAALAVDGLYRDAGRTAASASGLIASVALVVCMSTFTSSFAASLNTWAAQSVPGDLLITSGASIGGLSARNTPLSNALYEELSAIDGVSRVRRIRYAELDYGATATKLLSTDMRLFAERGRFEVLDGELAEMLDELDRGAVVVSENFARRHRVRRGDRLELVTKSGRKSFAVAGIVVDYTSDLGTILMDRRTYVAEWDDERVDTFELHLAAGVSDEAIRGVIDARLSPRHDLFVLTNREFRGAILDAADRIFSLLRLLQIVSILVAALGLITTILANVMDRVREIGVFRAVGMTRRQVVSMVLIEAALLGCFGVIGGSLLGFGSGYILVKHVITAQLGWLLPYHVPFVALALLLVAMPAVAALAGALPARRAARLTPRDALAYE